MELLCAGALLLASTTAHAAPTLDQNCTVNVLNRTVQVQPDGSWTLPNVPSNMGQIRARVTCVEGGRTESGQTGFFRVIDAGNADAGAFEFAVPDPAPVSLTIAPGGVSTLDAGEDLTLTVTAVYPDQSSRNVSAASTGINYSSTNPDIASVDADGHIIAGASGRALIIARQGGAVGIKTVTVTSNGDSDGDGLPDGEELIEGDDGFITNPLLADTDGDGINDNLELTANTDPTDPTSFNYGPLLTGLDIAPKTPVIVYNTVSPTGASRQFSVTGTLQGGTSVDLTSTSSGTNYSSGDLSVANFPWHPGSETVKKSKSGTN